MIILKERHIKFNSASRQKGYSGGSVVKNLPANAGDVDLIPGLGRFLREMTPTPVFLPGKSNGQRSLVG